MDRGGSNMTIALEHPAPSVLDAMTPAQAAQSLGMTTTAVWKAIARGKLAAIGAAGSYQLARSEVERYRRESLSRQGPITTRCINCGHSSKVHETGQCLRCSDTYTMDPRMVRQS